VEEIGSVEGTESKEEAEGSWEGPAVPQAGGSTHLYPTRRAEVCENTVLGGACEEKGAWAGQF
jgi:hypothetical protein